MRFAYPYSLEAQPGGGFTVTFPDVPEAISEADAVESACDAAEDALVAALSFYVDDDEDLPKPSAARGRPLAVVPPLAAAKLALHAAMRDARVSTAELARRLRIDEKAVRRLRDPLHRSHIGQVDAAMRALGLRLEVAASKAA